MKKLLLLPLVALLWSCNSRQENKNNVEKQSTSLFKAFDSDFPKVKEISKYPNSRFVTTLENKFRTDQNIIYSSTLCLAWESIQKELSIPFSSCQANDLNFMTNSKSFQNTLNSEEYNTNTEVIKDPLTGLRTIKAEAYFKKSLPFEYPLNRYTKNFTFNKDTVEAFGFDDEGPVYIMYYNNDEDFAVKLYPKDKTHEIILIKTDFKSETTLNQEIKRLQQNRSKFLNTTHINWKRHFTRRDKLRVPSMAFHLEHLFYDIMGTRCMSDQPFRIDKFYQKTAFNLDESGAKVESYGFTEVAEEAAEGPIGELSSPKKLYFNKNYIIMLKRSNQDFPYFAMFVNDSDFMIPFK